MKTKTVDFAYPTSENAARFRMPAGCWTLEVSEATDRPHYVAAFATREQAIAHALTLTDVPWSSHFLRVYPEFAPEPDDSAYCAATERTNLWRRTARLDTRDQHGNPISAVVTAAEHAADWATIKAYRAAQKAPATCDYCRGSGHHYSAVDGEHALENCAACGGMGAL